jgi:hypothetical protein
LVVVDQLDTNVMLGIGSWSAVASSVAALIALVFQNIIALMKARAESEHMKALDDLERQRLLDRLEALERERGAD